MNILSILHRSTSLHSTSQYMTQVGSLILICNPILCVLDGCSLPLQGILQSSLFKLKPPCDSETTDFALTLQSSPFPLLSQGDHPTLGIPCWYLHPCESATAVNEFMAEEASDLNQETLCTRWLEIWLMVVGSVLNV